MSLILKPTILGKYPSQKARQNHQKISSYRGIRFQKNLKKLT